ncbi:hypothetical protein [Nocardia brasiliensis]|uniref:hypothetical protein n=1 Tax=Nocardia brasiliensis TaxID=37326 RepID=UPI003D8D7DD1
MTESGNTYDPPQDTGDPDAVETDPAALNSAEDLDEDRLRLDPQEAGMDPPEHWSGATKYGMTPWEESHPRPLAERLAEEQPDVAPDSAQPVEDAESPRAARISKSASTRKPSASPPMSRVARCPPVSGNRHRRSSGTNASCTGDSARCTTCSGGRRGAVDSFVFAASSRSGGDCRSGLLVRRPPVTDSRRIQTRVTPHSTCYAFLADWLAR